ncbi:MAG: sulfotransferase [Bacteroidota bacterium]
MSSELQNTDLPVVFIVGNSRSGTTMMMRIMNNHRMIHSINEPHFFEKMWTPKDDGKQIGQDVAFDLYAKLFTGQRAGFFEPVEKHVSKYKNEINELISKLGDHPTRLAVYTSFLNYETQVNGKSIPCEKTPQNVFYLKEILEKYPNARIINMVRDPRAVMLSQKRKWKRRALGADFMTKKETLRLQINYHPLAVSKLWNAAISAAKPFEGEQRFKTVRFEDILKNPEDTVKSICEFANFPYEPEMLQVPHAGSSSEADKKSELGIRKTRAKGWLEKGLTKTEIEICQSTCGTLMDEFHYEAIQVKVNPIELAWKYLIFPFKMVLALLINLNRMRNIVDTLKRRLFQ